MSDTAAPIREVKRLTILERLKKLDDERTKLIEDATKEARDKADAAIADLNALGHNFRLVEADGTKTKKAGTKRQLDPTKPCSICKFATEPNHDGRQHRNQEPKKPFTAKELEELGMKKKA